MTDIFRCALKSLTRKLLRTILTVSSITIGVTLVVIVNMISTAGTKAVNTELESLGISGLSISTNSTAVSSGKTGITAENLKIIRETDNVSTAMPLMMEYSTSILRNLKSNTLICGIDAGANQVISLSLKHGRLISKSDVAGTEPVCVIDETLAKEAYGRENVTGKTISLKINGSLESFKIIGISEAGSSILQNIGEFIPSMVYIPYTTLQLLTGREYFDQVAVRVNNKEMVNDTQNLIIDRLQKTSSIANYFRADNLSVQRKKMGNLLDIVTMVLTIISGISLIVSGLGIMTIMLVSVNERMREIGIKKAIGASRKRILLEFLTEAIVLSLIGSVTGIILGGLISLIGIHSFGLPVQINWTNIVFLIGFSVVIGTIFGVYPAIKASRLKPVDALRLE